MILPTLSQPLILVPFYQAKDTSTKGLPDQQQDLSMTCYRLAGQEFHLSCPVPELAAFEITGTQPGTAEKAAPFVSSSPFINKELISRTAGWVANAHRMVEIWSAPSGFLVRTEAGSDFTISPGGQEIRCASQGQAGGELNETDRQILLGPVLVLALALRATWSLHASAAIHNDNLILFLGESGQGKSTLAAYLANETNWRLVADDILPVTMDSNGVMAWPRFPQLKLPKQAQPGSDLPEQLPICTVCVLRDTGKDEMPGLELLPANRAVQVWLGHTAGTRMFPSDLLAMHLDFCAEAAGRMPVYRLTYPHRWDALPNVRKLLEKLF